MKRTLTTILAVMFAAVGAQAATFSVDADSALYSDVAGTPVTITVTMTTEAGDTLNFLNSYFIQIGWDPGIVKVLGSDPGASMFGNSSQVPVLVGLSGSPTPVCANSADRCTVITQANAGFTPVAPLAGTIVIGTLLLEVLDGAGGQSLGLSVTAMQNITNTDTGQAILGANFQGATIIPEPTTAALLGLGLLGLGFAGRRRA